MAFKTITKITPQKKGERFNIFLDNEFYCGVTRDTLEAFRLTKGAEYSEEDLREIEERERGNRGFDYCVWLLSRKSYFEKDLEEKLLAKSYTEEDIREIITNLTEQGYINPLKKITKITPQQRGDRYNIFLDDEFFCGVTEETLIGLNLKKGSEYTEEDLREIIAKEHRNRGFDYCVWLLSRKSYFTKELVQKLKRKEYEEEDIDFILEKLRSYKYLDDERLAQAFINDKKRFSKKGPRFIQQALLQKGVDREIISGLLEESYLDEEEFEVCEKEAVKKLRSYQRKESDSYKLKNKLYGYLAGRGFSSTIISSVLREIDI